MAKQRCVWLKLNNPDYVVYHDREWGRPVHDDIKHFEMITLEGAQAGLSWETVLKKRARVTGKFLPVLIQTRSRALRRLK